MSRTFERSSRIDAPVEALFDWHARDGAFERLVPPWENVEVVERSGGIRDGDRRRLSSVIADSMGTAIKPLKRSHTSRTRFIRPPFRRGLLYRTGHRRGHASDET